VSQTIQITAENIEAASKRDSRRCMIAEAIQQANPGWRNIMVDLQSIRWSNPATGKRYLVLTPEDAAKALIAFDHGDADIKPFRVTLRPIQVTPLQKRERLSPEQLQLNAERGITTTHKVTSERGRRRVKPRSSYPTDSAIVVEGGEPMVPRGALPGTAVAVSSGESRPDRVKFDPAVDAGNNVKASRSDVRVFGRRLLRG